MSWKLANARIAGYTQEAAVTFSAELASLLAIADLPGRRRRAAKVVVVDHQAVATVGWICRPLANVALELVVNEKLAHLRDGHAIAPGPTVVAPAGQREEIKASHMCKHTHAWLIIACT